MYNGIVKLISDLTSLGERNKNGAQNLWEEMIMKYVCSVCGWEYDEEKGYPEGGIGPGTPWSEVPEDFECPLCSVGKDEFEES